MLGRVHIFRLLPLLGALVAQLAIGGLTAGAAPIPQADQVTWLSLNVAPAQSQRPTQTLDFRADVSYQLASAATGQLFLFVFENNTSTSSVHSDPIEVNQGAGRQTLSMSYQTHPGTKNLTIFAGLFSDKNALLGWTATDPVAATQWQAKAAYVAGIEAQQAGDYGSTVGDMTTAIKLAPKTASFYYWRGDAESHLGQYDNAIADFGQALSLTPNDRASQLGLGVAYLWKGDDQDAISNLTQVVQAGVPADQVTAWAYRALGIAYATIGQPSQAIAAYEQYLALSPQASDRDVVSGWIGQLQSMQQST